MAETKKLFSSAKIIVMVTLPRENQQHNLQNETAFDIFCQTFEINSLTDRCQQHQVLASETAHENMSFNAEPRASANTHNNHIQGCPESREKTNKNQTLQKKKSKRKEKALM